MLTLSKMQMADNFHDYPRDGYERSTLFSFAAAAMSVTLFLVMLFISFVYQIFYRPLLSWAGVDTVDGERFDFRSMVSEVFSRGKVVFAVNFKTFFFTLGWSLLFVIPGVIKGCSYSMANYLLKREPDLDSAGAIALSRELMKGCRLEYMIFQASFFFWFLAQGYSFGLAGFYVMPYYSTSEAIFFDEIYYEKRKLKQYSPDNRQSEASDF